MEKLCNVLYCCSRDHTVKANEVDLRMNNSMVNIVMTELQTIRGSQKINDQWTNMIHEINQCDEAFENRLAYKTAIKSYTSQVLYK